MTRIAIRLRHTGTNQRFVVQDGHVYEDLKGDGRIDKREQRLRPPPAVVAAADSIVRSYELAYALGAPAVGDDTWVSEGTLNAAELLEFEGEGVPVVRTALERHLDFFDIETRDGIISLRENWRGWRRLGYGWLRALIGTVGAAVVFGRPLWGFSIDIAHIQKKRRRETSGLYDARGDVNAPLLNACLAGFDALTKLRRVQAGPDALRKARRPIVQNTGARYYQAELLRLRGECALAVGEPGAKAEDLFWRAREVARGQEARSFELRVAISLARLFGNLRRTSDARTALAEIYGWFREGFDTEDLREASELLAALQ